MRIVIIRFAILYSMLTVILILSLIWAKSRPTPDVVTFLESSVCRQPCIQNIQPGISVIQNDVPYSTIYNQELRVNKSGAVRSVAIYPKKQLLLGQIITLWGMPSHVILQNALTLRGDIQLRGMFYFHDGLVVVWASATNPTLQKINPSMQVGEILYGSPSPEGNLVPLGAINWKGFAGVYTVSE